MGRFGAGMRFPPSGTIITANSAFSAIEANMIAIGSLGKTSARMDSIVMPMLRALQTDAAQMILKNGIIVPISARKLTGRHALRAMAQLNAIVDIAFTDIATKILTK
jgi:hypothetical protein